EPSEYFTLVDATGELKTTRGIDRESLENDVIELLVVSSSSAPPVEITVEVLDVNDNHPIFKPPAHVDVNIPESTEAGAQVLLTVHATDLDEGANGMVRYTINRGSDVHRLFSVDPVSGVVTLVGQLDYEVATTHRLSLEAHDGGLPVLEVVVNSPNLHPPVFSTKVHRVRISEIAPIGSYVANVAATDRDRGITGRLRYRLAQGDVNNWFRIDAQSGLITTSSRLRYQTTNHVTLIVTAQDESSMPRFANCSVEVAITDADDNPPVFVHTTRTISTTEAQPPGPLITVQATDVDTVGKSIVYSISRVFDENNHVVLNDEFVINPTSGEISTTATLTRDVSRSYNLSVVASNQLSVATVVQIEIVVEVSDTNDNPPYFAGQLAFSIRENEPKGTYIGTVRAYDADIGIHGSIVYSLPSEGVVPFAVHPFTGEITSVATLDAENLSRMFNVTNNTFALTVRATDNNGSHVTDVPTHSSDVTIEIKVDDVNEFPPSCRRRLYRGEVAENSANGTRVIQITSHDMDYEDDGFEYSISPPDVAFVIDPHTGWIMVSNSARLNIEEKMVHELVVEVSDTTGSSGRCVVEVQLSGVNDNSPIFQPSSLTWLVPESAPLHSEIGRLRATDYDVGDINNEVTYALSPSNDPEIRRTFVVEASSGRIILTRSLDRETIGSYDVIVTSQDSDPVLPMTSTATCSVIIKDANDNRPRFVGSMEFHVTEGYYATATNIGAMATTDDDVGANGIVTYRIVGHGGGGEVEVGIDPNSGRLSVGGRLDREQFLPDGLFRITVVATDSATHPVDRMSAVGVVVITVLDFNDNAPLFQQSFVEVFVSETTSPGDVISTASARDVDQSQSISYSLRPITGSEDFRIDPRSAEVTVGPSGLDRERRAIYTLHGELVGIIPRHTVEARVFVEIENINDNPPVFQLCPPRVVVSEGVDVGQYVTTIQANDADIGLNGIVEYYIVSGDASGQFKIAPDTGVVTVQRPLDHEIQPQFNLVVMATDAAPISSRHRSYCDIIIEVSDINDHAPQLLSPPTLYMPESSPAGTNIGTLGAYDQDESTTGVIYTLMSQSPDDSTFILNQTSGSIYLVGELDFERNVQHMFGIMACDRGVPRMCDITNVTVVVVDVNDESPVISPASISVNIKEGHLHKLAIHNRVNISQLTASDKDTGLGGIVDFRSVIVTSASRDRSPITPPSGASFTISSTGIVTLTQALDREEASQYTLDVIAVDRGTPSLTSTGSILIIVGDVNEFTPVFQPQSYWVNISENAGVGVEVTQVSAVDHDAGEFGVVRYELLEDFTPFVVDPSTGIISVSRGLDREMHGRFTLHVVASDHEGGVIGATHVVIVVLDDVNDNQPMFDQPVYDFYVHSSGGHCGVVHASDRDSGANGEVVYTVESTLFHIDPHSGMLTASLFLDFETKTSYQLWVEARDSGTPPVSAFTNLTINVVDANDNPPRFNHNLYVGHVIESTPSSTITRVSAWDPDTMGGVTYSMVSGGDSHLFELHPVGGTIRNRSPLNRELRQSYFLTVEATDGLHSSTTGVKIIVDDINDNAPRFTKLFTATVREDAEIGDYIIQVTSTDMDSAENSRNRYELSDSGNDAFTIHPTTG
uniref:Cadherin domain-containing protein n=1 Tax=Ciona savignyi TaxID=51511 RepID=H2YNK6_CIOSA